MNRIFFLLIIMLLLFHLNGCCSIPLEGKNGTVHHLIIGIGVVTIPEKADNTGVFATKSESIGLHFSNQPGLKFAAGYSKSSTIIIPETTENIVVEVSQRPFGPLTVEVNPSYKGGKNNDD